MKFLSVIAISFLIAAFSYAGGVDAELKNLQDQWLKANYQLEGKAQITAFEALLNSSDSAIKHHPRSAELLTWDGIIKSSFANAKGGLGALGLAKASRKSLQAAIDIDPEVLNGSAYTSLGILLAKVPGWPIGFGDDKKAGKLLQEALKINPDGIDSNYFYGVFLMDAGNDKEAQKYLQKAAEAPPRLDRPEADIERKKEIQKALAKVRAG